MPKKKTPELDPKEQFKRFQEAAKELTIDQSGDYTVHIVVGVDPDDNLYILDIWTTRCAECCRRR